MSSPNAPGTALKIIIVLLAVGGIAYAAFPMAGPGEPVRLVYKGSAGGVVFTHAVHASEDGYVQDCLSCHHNIEDDDVYQCRQCHGDDGDPDLPGITDALHTQCIRCHEDVGAGPVDCAGCHRTK
ncbi:MAG: cytochrome c3 family protein [Desulfobacter sp.]|nr:MAG: cytochrome c3 family protein [Desulfobacter sp.]